MPATARERSSGGMHGRRTAFILGLVSCAPSLVAAAPPGTPPVSASAAQDYSAAERLLLMTPQLAGIKPGTQLRYRFVQRGSQEPHVDETVTLDVINRADGRCCSAQAQFLRGGDKVDLPEVQMPEGNPITLYFLEHDVRDMNRRTKGSTQYFRKRIRMALYESAQVSDVQFVYKGRPVSGKEIILSPYVDDPNKARFEPWTPKRYRFLLSPQVAGGVARISTMVDAAVAGRPLYDHDLILDGVDA